MGGIVSGIGSFLGGQAAADAQKKSAKIQAQQMEENRELLRPAIEAGDQSRGVLLDALGVNGREPQQAYFDNFQTDPGFQSAVDFGVRGLERTAAARGMGLSGNTLAGAGEYMQKSMYDAYQNRLSRLSALATGGQAQAGTLAGLGTQSAAQQGQALGNAGFYQGAGLVGAGNAVGSAFQTQSVLDAYRGPQGNQGVLGQWQTNTVPNTGIF